jgi:Putative transposase DNA-binding domain
VAQAAVVAHDVGSAAAQIMTAIAPKRIRSLVVLDGVCAGEWAMEAIKSIQAWDPKDARRLSPVLMRRLGRSNALREMLTAYEGESGGLRLIRAARDLDPRQTEHIGEALRASGVPALVLWGEHDEFLSIDAVGKTLAELLGSVFIVDERNTTRTCSSCRALTGPTGLDMLVVRTWVCSECGGIHDRDVNAARNILFAGRSSPSVRGNKLSPSGVPPSQAFSRCEAGICALTPAA